MRGVFGAGVATYLEESGLYKRIGTLRAASAGAFTAAYLMTLQTRLGSSIFYEELIDGFISTPDFWGGIWDRVANRYIRPVPRLPVRDAVNLDRLFRATTTNKKLLLHTLRNHEIDLWVKVLELESGAIRYFPCRRA